MPTQSHSITPSRMRPLHSGEPQEPRHSLGGLSHQRNHWWEGGGNTTGVSQRGWVITWASCGDFIGVAENKVGSREKTPLQLHTAKRKRKTQLWITCTLPQHLLLRATKASHTRSPSMSALPKWFAEQGAPGQNAYLLSRYLHIHSHKHSSCPAEWVIWVWMFLFPWAKLAASLHHSCTDHGD